VPDFRFNTLTANSTSPAVSPIEGTLSLSQALVGHCLPGRDRRLPPRLTIKYRLVIDMTNLIPARDLLEEPMLEALISSIPFVRSVTELDLCSPYVDTTQRVAKVLDSIESIRRLTVDNIYPFYVLSALAYNGTVAGPRQNIEELCLRRIRFTEPITVRPGQRPSIPEPREYRMVNRADVGEALLRCLESRLEHNYPPFDVKIRRSELIDPELVEELNDVLLPVAKFDFDGVFTEESTALH